MRVWAWKHENKVLKNEAIVFAGPICDIDWGGESKRICAVGKGRSTKCKTFMWDTGNSLGVSGLELLHLMSLSRAFVGRVGPSPNPQPCLARLVSSYYWHALFVGDGGAH